MLSGVMPLRGVVFDLLLAAAIGLGDRALHRARDADFIDLKDDLAVDIARGAADGLDQGRLAVRKNPSLSASRIATSPTSGMSRPSRSKLMPTSALNAPSGRSL